MECRSTIQRNEVLKRGCNVNGTDLGIIMLSERSQTQKTTYYITPSMWNGHNTQLHRDGRSSGPLGGEPGKRPLGGRGVSVGVTTLRARERSWRHNCQCSQRHWTRSSEGAQCLVSRSMWLTPSTQNKTGFLRESGGWVLKSILTSSTGLSFISGTASAPIPFPLLSSLLPWATAAPLRADRRLCADETSVK